MIKDILSSREEKMQKTLESLKREFASLRAGRATPSLLDKVMVDYYGTPTPVNQVAKVSVPEPRMIVIQPWEKTLMKELEKAIMKSDLGLTPNSDGTAIRLTIPQLTKERREELKRQSTKRRRRRRSLSAICAVTRTRPSRSWKRTRRWPRTSRRKARTICRSSSTST